MMLPGMSSPLRLLDCLEGVLYVSLGFENGFVSFFSVKLGVVGRLLSTEEFPVLASIPPPNPVTREDEGRRGVLGSDDAIGVKLGLKREMKSGRLTVENPEGWNGVDLGVLGGRAERLRRSFSCRSALSCLWRTCLPFLRFVVLFLVL